MEKAGGVVISFIHNSDYEWGIMIEKRENGNMKVTVDRVVRNGYFEV